MNKHLLLLLLPYSVHASDLQTIHTNAMGRVEYVWYSAYDFTPVPLGEVRQGNCAVAAATVKQDLEANGYTAEYDICRTQYGVMHARVVSEGMVFDNRFKTPIPYEVADRECHLFKGSTDRKELIKKILSYH